MKKITVCFLLFLFCLISNAQKTYYVISLEDSTIENIDSFILQKQAEKKDIIKNIKKNLQENLSEETYLSTCQKKNNLIINKLDTENFYIFDETNSILIDSFEKEFLRKDNIFQQIYISIEDKYNETNQINFSISCWEEETDKFEIFYFILGEIIKI